MKKTLAILLSLMLACAALGAAAEGAKAPAAAEPVPTETPAQTEAPAQPAEPAVPAETAPLFATVGEALEKGEATGSGTTFNDEQFVTVVRYNDRFIRVVASMDKETMAQLEALFASEDYENMAAKQDALFAPRPVLYTEDLTDAALSQEELDALAGKSVAELTAQGFELTSTGTTEDETGAYVTCGMIYGLFEYAFVMNESAQAYDQLIDSGNYDPLTVRSSMGVTDASYNATDLSWHADGTYVASQPGDEPFSSLLAGLSGFLNQAAQSGEAALESGKTTVDEAVTALDAALNQAGETSKTKLNELLASLTEVGETGKTKLEELLNKMGVSLSELGQQGEVKLDQLLQILREKTPALKNDLSSLFSSLVTLFQPTTTPAPSTQGQ